MKNATRPSEASQTREERSGLSRLLDSSSRMARLFGELVRIASNWKRAILVRRSCQRPDYVRLGRTLAFVCYDGRSAVLRTAGRTFRSAGDSLGWSSGYPSGSLGERLLVPAVLLWMTSPRRKGPAMLVPSRPPDDVQPTTSGRSGTS